MYEFTRLYTITDCQNKINTIFKNKTFERKAFFNCEKQDFGKSIEWIIDNHAVKMVC